MMIPSNAIEADGMGEKPFLLHQFTISGVSTHWMTNSGIWCVRQNASKLAPISVIVPHRLWMKQTRETVSLNVERKIIRNSDSQLVLWNQNPLNSFSI